CINHLLVAERLGQEINRSSLHGLDAHWNVTVSSDEDHGDVDAPAAELGLQIEAAQSRQSDVQYEAARNGRKVMLQKFGCGRKCLAPQVDRTKQHAQRAEHEWIVVHDVY